MPVRTHLLPAIGLGILLSLCIGCKRQQEEQPGQPAEQPAEKPAEKPAEQIRAASSLVEESAAARKALVAWFECEECTDHELERVVEYGDLVVPNLAATLEGGLSPSKREEIRQHLSETYLALVKYTKEHAKKQKDSQLQMSEREYLNTYLENAESLYRLRAATALDRIGTPAARAALERGVRLEGLRPDVRRTVENALREPR